MDAKNKPPVLAIVGPTASGKTALGIALARAHHGEIVSADSMQIYQGLDIATAKPSPEELATVPHHLIGVLPRTQSFSVAAYVEAANAAIRDIHARGKLPVVVGGTGLYITSLLKHVQFAEMGQDPALRQQLAAEAAAQGNAALHARLQAVDPETAAAVHPNNLPRVIRALEVYALTGRPLSAFRAESRLEESPYRTLWLGLTFADRQKLYDRIDARVDAMLAAGLAEEVREAAAGPPMATSAAAIGYKELLPWLHGTATLEACVAVLKQETRRYAKRQGTWFRKNEQIQWIYRDEFDKEDEISAECEKKIAKAHLL